MRNTKHLTSPKKMVIIGEHNSAWETHRFTNAALEHAQQALSVELTVEWCSTQAVSHAVLATASGFWIATGTPYQQMENALAVIRYARLQGIPCLGTCQGFQHIMLEYAQSFLGMAQPGHAEYDSSNEPPFIAELACSLRGQEAEVLLAEGSLARNFYAAARTIEKFYCSYGINPAFVPRLQDGPLRVAGRDAAGEIRVVEYPDHPFLIGTLFVPQAHSQPGNPHPLITAFVQAI